jgi:hypothetical protein
LATPRSGSLMDTLACWRRGSGMEKVRCVSSCESARAAGSALGRGNPTRPGIRAAGILNIAISSSNPQLDQMRDEQCTTTAQNRPIQHGSKNSRKVTPPSGWPNQVEWSTQQSHIRTVLARGSGSTSPMPRQTMMRVPIPSR